MNQEYQKLINDNNRLKDTIKELRKREIELQDENDILEQEKLFYENKVRALNLINLKKEYSDTVTEDEIKQRIKEISERYEKIIKEITEEMKLIEQRNKDLEEIHQITKDESINSSQISMISKISITESQNSAFLSQRSLVASNSKGQTKKEIELQDKIEREKQFTKIKTKVTSSVGIKQKQYQVDSLDRIHQHLKDSSLNGSQISIISQITPSQKSIKSLKSNEIIKSQGNKQQLNKLQAGIQETSVASFDFSKKKSINESKAGRADFKINSVKISAKTSDINSPKSVKDEDNQPYNESYVQSIALSQSGKSSVRSQAQENEDMEDDKEYSDDN